MALNTFLVLFSWDLKRNKINISKYSCLSQTCFRKERGLLAFGMHVLWYAKLFWKVKKD
jgi:hypothetical protein